MGQSLLFRYILEIIPDKAASARQDEFANSIIHSEAMQSGQMPIIHTTLANIYFYIKKLR